MAVIQNIKNKLGTIVYPKTLTKAVYEEDGTRLDNEISTITSDISSLNDTITPTSYTHDRLTFTGCNYVSGGYYKLGKIVIVNIRVAATTTSEGGVKIVNLPSYSNVVANSNCVSCSVLDGSSTVPTTGGFVSNSGELIISKTYSGRAYFVSCVYLCN